jgi:hypothetical protein
LHGQRAVAIFGAILLTGRDRPNEKARRAPLSFPIRDFWVSP